MNRLGIDLGEIDVMINVLPCLGHRYVYNDQKFELEKIYSQIKVAYPLKVRPILKSSSKFIRKYVDLPFRRPYAT
jgi:hypothetical protein